MKYIIKWFSLVPRPLTPSVLYCANMGGRGGGGGGGARRGEEGEGEDLGDLLLCSDEDRRYM